MSAGDGGAGAAPPKTVLVTGASSGIGEAVARAWGRRGDTVVLAGRDEAGLARAAREVEAAGGRAVVKRADVTREEDRVALVETARAAGATGATGATGGGATAGGGIDVLVNNAGRGFYGSVARIDPRELEALFALNVVAPLRLAQLALDPLTRTGGTIVMMSSVAGVVASPRMGAYAASKFALEALAMSLRAELVGTGVRVLVVRPGPVDTPFRARSVTTDGRAGVRPRGAAVQSPDEVAEQIARAVEAERAVLETTGFVRMASAAARHAPAAMRWISALMASRAGRD
ncbi:MAG TPA: SDR family oxidoreductase [Polyangiaceae bacterium]|jgi:short-subunit dehydrogenase